MRDKREALLDSALELFSTRGYQNTPTSLISKNAGVATGTLFHHFSSKEELINQLYLDCKMKWLTYISGKMNEAETTTEKIRKAWEGMISWALEQESPYLFIIQHQNAAFINRETREKAELHFSSLSNLIEQAVKEKIIRNLPSDLLTDMMLSMIMGSVSFFLKNREKFDDKAYREAAYSMFFNSLK